MSGAEEWVKIHVRLPASEKIEGCTVEARWLYVVGLCIAGRDLTDGQLRPAVVLAEADLPEGLESGSSVVEELVRAGLWHRSGHGCTQCPPVPRGRVLVHDYLVWNRSKAEVEAFKAERSASGRKGAEVRWGKHSHADSSSHGSPHGYAIAESESESESDHKSSQSPTPLTAFTYPTTDDLDKIRETTKGSRAHAGNVWTQILSRAAKKPQRPLRYVLAAIEKEPERYRYHRGSPKKPDECPDHPGEWADACRAHAADKKGKPA